jgi:hypothetical protein
MQGKPAAEVPVRWASRAVMASILLAQLALIRVAWSRRQSSVQLYRRAA